MTARRDNDYWQRLRKDRRSNAAAIAAALCGLFGTLGLIMVAVEGDHQQARANPVYWLLMLPLVWWVSDLTSFTRRSIRIWTPAIVIACVLSCAVFVIGIQRPDLHGILAVNLCATLVTGIASLVLRHGSLVEREGPAR